VPRPLPGASRDLQVTSPKIQKPAQTEERFPTSPGSVQHKTAPVGSAACRGQRLPSKTHANKTHCVESQGSTLAELRSSPAEGNGQTVTSLPPPSQTNSPPVPAPGETLSFAVGLPPPPTLSAGCGWLGSSVLGPSWTATSAPASNAVARAGWRRRQAPRSRAWQRDRVRWGSDGGILGVTRCWLTFPASQLLRSRLGLRCCGHGRLFLPLWVGRNWFYFVKVTRCCCRCRPVLDGRLVGPCKGRGKALQLLLPAQGHPDGC